MSYDTWRRRLAAEAAQLMAEAAQTQLALDVQKKQLEFEGQSAAACEPISHGSDSVASVEPYYLGLSEPNPSKMSGPTIGI